MELSELKTAINSLAKSQGYYWRLAEQLNSTDKWEELLEVVNENWVKDSVDLVLFLEGE